jgi:hypothetical protein
LPPGLGVSIPGRHEADPAAVRALRVALQRVLNALIFGQHLGRDRGAGSFSASSKSAMLTSTLQGRGAAR